jgi:hypothetical protein
MAKTTTKNEEYTKLVDEKSEEGQNWNVLKQIQVNRSFYKGQQWISYDRVQKRVYVPELKPGEKRYTYNKIKPHIMTLLAKLTKNRVQLEVHPDTNDDERIEVAKAGHKYLKYQWQEDKMDHKSRRLKLHMLIDGMPVLKVYADKSQGNEFTTDDGQTMKTGKIITLVRDQMAIKLDPTAEDTEEIKWVLEEFPKEIDEIKEEYGVEVQKEEIQMPESFDINLSNEAKKKYTNHAMLKEYWELPCPKYPKGRKIAVAGGQLLDYTEDPGEFPYIFFPMIPIPGSAIATGSVTDMTTPQLSYNIKRTAEARILEEMGNPMWMTPTNSVEDPDDLTNEIGGRVEYMPINGSKPERVQGIEPGNGWQSAMERDEADMEDISGAHEISQGAMPKGVDTYGGLQLLVEQDETRLSVAAHSYEEGIKRWGEKVLRLVQKHFPEEQQLQIVGENGEVDAFTFAGADLSGSEVVDVIPNSSMPEVKAVKDAKIFQMWGAGMFNNPKTGMPDTRKVTRMLGQAISSEYFDDTELDENKAKSEQKQWETLFSDPQAQQILGQYTRQVQMFEQQSQEFARQGVDITQLRAQPPQAPVKLPQVRDFYDHETHLEVHNRFRKGDLYDNLPPELQYIIDQHCMEHEQALMAPQIAEQQAQQQQEQSKMKQSQQESADKHARDLEKETIKGDMRLQEQAMKRGGI